MRKAKSSRRLSAFPSLSSDLISINESAAALIDKVLRPDSINESAAALIDKVQKLEDTLREKLVLIVPLLCDKDKPKQPCDHK